MASKKKSNFTIVRSRSATTFTVGEAQRNTGTAVAFRAGSRVHPLAHSSRCRTCNSPLREEFEDALIRNWTMPAIMRRIDQSHVPEEEWVSVTSLRNHHKSHMGLGVDDISYLMAEAWMEKTGRSLEDHHTVVTHLGTIELVMQKAFNRIANDLEQPTVADGLTAARLMLEYEGKLGGQMDASAFLGAMTAYLDVTKQYLTADQLAEFSAAIDAHPMIRKMIASAPNSEDIIEVDEWEDEELIE